MGWCVCGLLCGRDPLAPGPGAAQVPARATDPYLIGWQTDNEINWVRLGLDTYLTTYGDGAGGARALAFLQARYPTLAALNAAWAINADSWADVGAHMHDPGFNAVAEASDDADWLGEVAGQYFAVTVGAIRWVRR
jgi:hypothetical protein